MSRILLLDNNDPNNTFFAKEFDRVIISPSLSPLPLAWILGTIKTIVGSKNHDNIVCWYDFQAVILFWLCKIFFQKRYIYCLNILLKPKTSLMNKLVSLLYKKALSSPNFTATVTSKDYGKLLNSHFNNEYNYTILHDVYHSHYCMNSKSTIAPNTVFCGGRNGRDWDFMMEVASNMPDVNFNVIAPSNVYNKYKDIVGSNVNLMTNVPYEKFMSVLCESQITALPLDTEAPAGLIVMFQAAANGKLILTTNTATTREYVSEDRGCLLDNNLDSWINGIHAALSNPQTSETKAEKIKAFLESECSEERFINIINEMINNHDQTIR